jgi:heme A synthase
MSGMALLQKLAAVDPAPLFSLSLFPYLAFLWWAWRSRRFPRLALIGFALTLVFVGVTIAAALVAEARYGRQLADVDALHGGAESVLTLCNLLVLLGFSAAEPPSQQPSGDEQV